jgi:hypothetical protein
MRNSGRIVQGASRNVSKVIFAGGDADIAAAERLQQDIAEEMPLHGIRQ